MSISPLFVQSRKKIIAVNTLSQLLGRFITSGTMFVITLLIARAYGADGYGDFIKITSFVALFYLFVDFGLNAIFLRQTVSPSGTFKELNQHWSSLVGLRVFGSLLFICIALVLLAFLPQGQSQGYTTVVRLGILFLIPSILFQALLTSVNALFQRRLRYDLSTIAIGAGSFFSIAVIIFVVWRGIFGYGVFPAVSAILLGSFVSCVVSVLLAKYLEPKLSLTVNVQMMKQLFWASLPLGITLAFNLIYFRADNFILALTRPTSEVGIYALAYKFFEVPLVFPTFFMNAAYPLLLSLEKKRVERKKFLTTSFFLLLTSGIVIACVVYIGSPAVGLVKSDFESSVRVLRILALSLPFFFVSSLCMWGLIAKNKLTQLACIYGGSMLINIGLNVLFIPQYGYMAASWITLITEGVVLLASGSIFAKLYFLPKV